MLRIALQEMGALAPLANWIPEDDLLLKNAVEVIPNAILVVFPAFSCVLFKILIIISKFLIFVLVLKNYGSFIGNWTSNCCLSAQECSTLMLFLCVMISCCYIIHTISLIDDNAKLLLFLELGLILHEFVLLEFVLICMARKSYICPSCVRDRCFFGVIG